MVLSGKDIELLLLKKEVQDKLVALSDIDIKNLPTTVNKNVSFVPGTVDFGFLQDTDQGQPISTTIKRASVTHCATQTEWLTDWLTGRYLGYNIFSITIVMYLLLSELLLLPLIFYFKPPRRVGKITQFFINIIFMSLELCLKVAEFSALR